MISRLYQLRPKKPSSPLTSSLKLTIYILSSTALVSSSQLCNVFNKTVQNTIHRRKFSGNGETTTIRHPLSFQLMTEVRFTLEGEYVELNQLLKLVGLCDSGGIGKQMVASGIVSVDGRPELRKTAKIRRGQRVMLQNVLIRIV
jgi:ribosome-associated protein